MKTSNFRIVPLPTEVAETARMRVRQGAADHRLVRAETPRTYPCRHCLRWVEPGEEVVLFPYASIPAGRPWAESGPIFVHAGNCERYRATAKFPSDFREGRVVRSYDKDYDMVSAEIMDGVTPECLIETIFANPAVAFLQVRSADRACYTFKIERA